MLESNTAAVHNVFDCLLFYFQVPSCLVIRLQIISNTFWQYVAHMAIFQLRTLLKLLTDVQD